MIRTFLLAAATFAVAPFAVAQDRKPGEDRKPAEKAYSDAEFVKMATQCSMLEVKLGKLAAEQSKSDDVKKLANTLVRDHQGANEKLAAVAKELNIQLPTEIDAECKKCLEKFEAMKNDFNDKEYVTHVIEAHQKAIQWCKKASAQAQNQNLKDLADTMTRTLQTHLEMAKKI